MPFGDLGSAKAYLAVAPKYRNIVEPFGDKGTLAMVLEKRKPKVHIVNYTDETTYKLMLFLQNITSAQLKQLKAKDWISSPETFAAVSATTPIDGVDLFHRVFYIKKFGAMAKDPTQPMVYDWLTAGQDVSKTEVLMKIPIRKVSLRGVTLLLDDPISVIRRASGPDTWVVLVPKTPEHIEAVERILPISSPYLYAKKSKSRDILATSVISNTTAAQTVSYISAGAVMPGTTEIRVNYASALPDISLILPA